MSSDRSSASLTSFAPGGEALPGALLLIPGGPDFSEEFIVVHEPVRLMIFTVGQDTVSVEQIAVAVTAVLVLVTSANLNRPGPLKFVPWLCTRP